MAMSHARSSQAPRRSDAISGDTQRAEESRWGVPPAGRRRTTAEASRQPVMSVQVAGVFLAWLLLAPVQDAGANLGPANQDESQAQQQQQQARLASQDETRHQFEMRILALFTGSANDLGLNYQLGRQVLKMAADKARGLTPGLTNLELVFYNDDNDCSSNVSGRTGDVPIWVAEQFYLDERFRKGRPLTRAPEATNVSASLGGSPLDSADDDLVVDGTTTTQHCSLEPGGCPEPTAAVAGVGAKAASAPSRVDAILGPSCDHQIDQVARMAAHWRVPVYIVTPTSGKFAHKDIYSTMTRVAPSIDHLSWFIVRLLEHFKWRHLALVVDLSQSENSILVKSLDKTIDRLRYSANIEHVIIPVESGAIRATAAAATAAAAAAGPVISGGEPQVAGNGPDSHSSQEAAATERSRRCTSRAREVLDQVRRVARVVLILLNEPVLVRSLLLCGHEMGFNNGEFVFLTVNLGFKGGRRAYEASSSAGPQGSTGGAHQAAQVFEWFAPNDEDDNLRARQMFESLMVFSVELPIDDEFNLFAEQALDMARQEFSHGANSSQTSFEAVGPIAVALHDSLLLAVEAKRRRHQRQQQAGRHGNLSGQPPPAAPLMWNSTYSAGLMTDMKINANGDQELDYVLSDMEPELGIMRPVASFSRQKLELNFLPDSYIHWPIARASRRAGIASGGDHDGYHGGGGGGGESSGEAEGSQGAANAYGDGEPPPDEPECGFMGEAERCIDRRNMHTALAIVSLFLVAVIVILVISFQRYKKIKYQMQLDDYWWRINWAELEFVDLQGNSLHSKLGSNSVVCLRRRPAHLGTSGSVVSSGKVSLASGPLQLAPAAATKTGGPQSSKPRTSRAFIGENLFRAIRRPSEELESRQNQVSLVVTPAAISPDEQDGEHDEAGARVSEGAAGPPARAADNTDRLSLASGGSRTVRANQAAASAAGHTNSEVLKSDLSTVVRSSSLALYKDEVVIVKQLNAQSVEVSRELLVELKAIRELAHENLARLVGLCVETNRVASVYVYCSRGNLQDLLLNDQIHMDWDLKYSIIGDLLNGLSYIHTTLLDFHGRLKSTNLVIDSRFTVKLTDFGLKSLYQQLDLIAAPDDETGDNDDDDVGGEHENCSGPERRPAAANSMVSRQDSLRGEELEFRGRCQSAVASVYNMDSVSMQAESLNALTASGAGNETSGGDADLRPGAGPTRPPNRMQMKNRASARFFWTAPELLRQRQAHLAASAKGDIYSLGIILYEIYTRKEPYYFGTNAQPLWSVIRREKVRHSHTRSQQQQQQQYQSATGLDGRQRRASQLKSQLSTQSSRPSGEARSWRKRSNQVADLPLTSPGRKASSGGDSDQQSEVSVRSSKSVLERAAPPAGDAEHRDEPDDSTVTGKSVAFTGDGSGKSSSSAQVKPAAPARYTSQKGARKAFGSSRLTARRPARGGRARELPVVVDLETSEQAEQVEGEQVGEGNAAFAAITTGQHTGSNQLDAKEILDQIRIGVKPEPVRPYIPNFLLADIEPKLVDLLRSCWSEAPSSRPSASQVRNSMRKITRGATARNYLDNLLERLQTYANQLERIVDFRSADILAEKMRTEELLYQLVPRFVADKLKQNEPVVPRLYEGVTIFFSDIVGFEKYASVMSPCEMVDLLNNINSSFEDIIRSFDVTKIEVILDQFLVAAGISLDGAGHQQAAATVAGGAEQADTVRAVAEQSALGSAQDARGANNSSKAPGRGKLLGSFRRSNQSSSLEGSREGNNGAAVQRQSSRQQDSWAESQDSKFNDSLPTEGAPVAAGTNETELYRRSGAEQIARMALCIRDLVKSFHFRQNLSSRGTPTGGAGQRNESAPEDVDAQAANTGAGGNFVAANFNIRIGIHSGKVCAGLVGLKRPKFCLIGDAVNVASRMHTNGKANKIQISPDTRELLKQVSGFNIVPRGRIEIKGKGLMETFWLESAF